MSKRPLPEWKIEDSSPSPVLKLYNSFTRKKETFIPKNGNSVLWYSCGPTVYDASHMGHARSYITFDILRRVLSGYFGFDVFYVMNITDIDDKIIKRARQTHLYAQYKNKNLEHILSDTKEALQFEINKLKATNNPELDGLISKMTNEVGSAISNLENAVLSKDEEAIRICTEALLKSAKDPLSDFLDSTEGCKITDNSIFSELPRYWESEFHKDMDALHVLRPNVLTRVSDYIEEIIEYIKKIINNGMAYVSNGSVYFDVASFDSRGNHHYAKLVPEAYGDAASLESGEGELTESIEKKFPTDFALWKKSKPGEPLWPSPWGDGRPGWHIECSVMASAICGDTLDIHTGGIDLKFPHHDNEIAQAEAYFDKDTWVRYFLHAGHLTISGCKMSKSLKNFITISDALKIYSARQLRLAFLLHSWKDTLDYSENTMEIAKSYEKLFNEFFLTTKDLTKSFNDLSFSDRFVKWSSAELEIENKFKKMKCDVHNALCDNVDTRKVLDSFRDIIGICNTYIRGHKINMILLRDIALFITKMLNLFGVIYERESIGFPLSGFSDEVDVESIIMPFANVMGQFRDDIRNKARTLKAIEILNICDDFRDNVLPDVGVRLEDKEGGPSAVKLVDKEVLIRERNQKKLLEEEKARKKQALEELQNSKEAQKKIDPCKMFLSMTDKFSKFDESGIPTHDVDGNEISKGQTKKLIKLQQAQKKKYEEYLSSVQ